IKAGRFTLDGRDYHLPLNNEPQYADWCLHGGKEGFSHKLWTAEVLDAPGAEAVRLSYTSADGEEGFPGRLDVRVTFELRAENELKLSYWAQTDAPTPVNLTNHAYFNLKGEGQGDILDHEVQIAADGFAEVDAQQFPTGIVREVAGTPLDFREARKVGERIDAEDAQVQRVGGYDHFFVKPIGHDMAPLVTVYEPGSGRLMSVMTSEPGVQFYSGNNLKGDSNGKGGSRYERRTGLCFETQGFSDAVNRPEFPSIILRPGKNYESETIYKFSAR
ncbi:MAG: aldose epimerase family protein, partial [Verrucomicrobiota bacterium]